MDDTSITTQEWATLRSRRHWTIEEGQRVLAALEASGESAPVFAGRHGLRADRLRRWRLQLAGWRPGPPEASACFVPAVVRQAVPAIVTAAPVVSLRVGPELQIDVADPGAVAPEWLAALVRGMGAAR